MEVLRMNKKTRVWTALLLVLTILLLGRAVVPPARAATSLTVYASDPDEMDQQLVAAFEKQTGDDVDLWISSTGKVLARLQTEQANPHADVVIVADQSAGLALQSQGMVATYRPQATLDRLRPALNLPSNFLPMGADTVAIIVNTQRLPPGGRPRDWDDLLTPAYRDQVSMPSPLLSGTAAEFVLGFLQQRGDAGWQYFARLKGNGAIWPGENAAAIAPVQMGSRSVLMAGVGHTALEAKAQGNSLDLVLPASGTLLIPRPIMILSSSKQMDTAKRFVDFVLSDAGQELAAKALLVPAVKTVAAEPVWPALDRAKFWTVDWDKMARDREAVLKRFDSDVIH
jgi:iron(III) transport system substrate-binding protein